MPVSVLLGRILFSLIFIFSGMGHFTEASIAHGTANGVPFAPLIVPLSGAIAFLGGLSILLGYRAKLGSLLIMIFLVPVTFTMHRFWEFQDPSVYLIQMSAFMKNVSMLGAALIISYFGAGPFSFDARRT